MNSEVRVRRLVGRGLPGVIRLGFGGIAHRYRAAFLAGGLERRLQYADLREVDVISGCAILVRRAAIEQAGMLDKDYFIYWEETEWCIRIGRAGWKILNVPQAHVWHKGVQRNYQPKPSFTYYGTRNHLLTLAKHKAPLNARIFTWMQILRTFVAWSILPKWRNKREHRKALWAGVMDHFRCRYGPMPVTIDGRQ